METIGRYELQGQLGKGGMALVMKAHDPLFDRPVAIKLLPPETAIGSETRSRFLQEARALAALEHPAIVPVYDFGELDTRPYLVMRLMSGGSLRNRLLRGPVDVDVAAEIIERIADALDVTHAQDIVHRDVKPANILFDRYDNAYLSDFGLVRLAEHSVRLTLEGVLGTPQYMAPEMVIQDDISYLADVYALTVTLYEMLTTTRPFNGTTPLEIIRAHISDPIPDVRLARPDLPREVQLVLEKGLAKSTAERYQTAGEMAADFAEAIRKRTDKAVPTPVTAQQFVTEDVLEPKLSIVQKTKADVDIRPYLLQNDLLDLDSMSVKTQLEIPKVQPQKVPPRETELMEPPPTGLEKTTETMQQVAEDPYKKATHEHSVTRPEQPQLRQTVVHHVDPTPKPDKETAPNQQAASVPAAPPIPGAPVNNSKRGNLLRILLPVAAAAIILVGLAWLVISVLPPVADSLTGAAAITETATPVVESSAVGADQAAPEPGTVGSELEITAVSSLRDDAGVEIRSLAVGETVTLLARSSEIRGNQAYVRTNDAQEGWVPRENTSWNADWEDRWQALNIRVIVPTE